MNTFIIFLQQLSAISATALVTLGVNKQHSISTGFSALNPTFQRNSLRYGDYIFGLTLSLFYLSSWSINYYHKPDHNNYQEFINIINHQPRNPINIKSHNEDQQDHNSSSSLNDNSSNNKNSSNKKSSSVEERLGEELGESIWEEENSWFDDDNKKL